MGGQLLVVIPLPLPAVGGLETHYTDMVFSFAKLGARIILLTTTGADKTSFMRFAEKARAEGISIHKIPVTPPDVSCQAEHLFFRGLCFVSRMILFWTASLILSLHIISKHRVRWCMVRHSIKVFPLVLLLRILRTKILADGAIFSHESYGQIAIPLALRSRKNQQEAVILRILTLIATEIERLMFRCYNIYRAISPTHARYAALTRLAGPARIRMIPIGMDLQDFEDWRPASSSRQVSIGYFGALERWWDLETLIFGFARAYEKTRRIQLHIFGTGSLEGRLREMAAGTNASQAIFFHGRLPREALHMRMRTLAVSVVPLLYSPSGGYPVKLIESMAAGLPLIATRVSPITDFFSSREIHFVNPRDPEEMAEAILALARDYKLRLRLASSARKKAAELDSARIYQSLLDQIMGNRELLKSRRAH